MPEVSANTSFFSFVAQEKTLPLEKVFIVLQ